MPEYINPNKHAVYLTGEDGKTVRVGAGQRKLLPEFFERYCGSKGYLTRIEGSSQLVVQPQPQNKKPKKIGTKKPPTQQSEPRPRRQLAVNVEARTPQRTRTKKHIVKRVNQVSHGRKRVRRPVVGRQTADNATSLLHSNLKIHQYPISNDIGVGILSFNRVASLRRLIDSIRKHTDLRNTTVFVSDDGSTDLPTKQYLDQLAAHPAFVVLKNSERLGIAGNTNRLLRCLSRFKYGILMNDDTEVLRKGWERFYVSAMKSSGLHHFCMRQPGVYGAKLGSTQKFNNTMVNVVQDKPHGAILAFTNELFTKIGYFDEKFGLYGMEHVDWSTRACASGMQPMGYYDVNDSDKYFRIHADKSVVPDRTALLAAARQLYNSLDPHRVHVPTSGRTSVPHISVVIPCRNTERHGAIKTVVAGIRAQKFPCINIVVVEHDVAKNLGQEIQPCNHLLVKSGGNRPFNKAKAFNMGVAAAVAPIVVLHDADLLVAAEYVSTIYKLLRTQDACHLGKSVIYLAAGTTKAVNESLSVDESTRGENVVGYFEGGSLACRRRAFWLVGGFNEDFWGYGVEDCEFYERLSAGCNFREERTFDFVHLFHGRTSGWQMQHSHNKSIGKALADQPMDRRLRIARKKLVEWGYEEQLNAATDGRL